jgi:hypothetical protein
MASESILIFCDVPDTAMRVVIEDDDEVAYAYLTNEAGKIVSYVWLYNVAPTPEQAEWADKGQMPRGLMPFLNPREFCRGESIARITYESAVSCAAREDYVDIEVDGVLIARLKVGAKPGWSKLACKKGPLALPLGEHNT